MNNEDEFNIEEIENFASSEIVQNERTIIHFIRNSYDNSFLAYDVIDNKLPNMPVDEIADVPTTVVLGSFKEPTKFMSLTFHTYDYELEEEEDLSVTVEKFKKHLYRLRNIISDMDFCMVSYPIVSETHEFTENNYYKFGLETVIFNNNGFIGAALSKRTQNRFTKSKDNELEVQFILPENKKYVTYKEMQRVSRGDHKAEALAYSRVIENYYDLPGFASEDALNSMIDEMSRDQIKIIASTETFREELRDKIMSLPLEGFILIDDNKKNKKEILETINMMISTIDLDDPESESVVEVFKAFYDEEE